MTNRTRTETGNHAQTDSAQNISERRSRAALDQFAAQLREMPADAVSGAADCLMEILEDDAPVAHDTLVQTQRVELVALPGEAFGSRVKRALELMFNITLLSRETRVTWDRAHVQVVLPATATLKYKRRVSYQTHRELPVDEITDFRELHDTQNAAVTTEEFTLQCWDVSAWEAIKEEKRAKLQLGSARELLRYGAMGPAIVELMERTLQETQEQAEAIQARQEAAARQLASLQATVPTVPRAATPMSAALATRRRLRNIRIRSLENESGNNTDTTGPSTDGIHEEGDDGSGPGA